MTDQSSTTESAGAGAVDAELTRLRSEIDRVDDEILDLLNRRAHLAMEIGRLKQGTERTFYVPSRERSILERLCKRNPGPFTAEGLRAVFGEIISASRALERTLTIAYLGPQATFSHYAGLRRFGQSATYVPYAQVAEVFEAVAKSQVDYGVVAIENSTEGVVNSTLDLFLEWPVKIYAEVYVDIVHCLLSRFALNQIKVIYSHGQALAQCRQWIRQTLPQAETHDVGSTTRGVELALKEEGSAAIAGAFAAEYYNIPIVAKSIQDLASNTTRFVVIGHDESPPSGNDKTSIVLFIRDRPGALVEALLPFRIHDINMTHIHNRPTRREAWQYTFYIDFLGHIQDPRVQNALRDLEEKSLYVKVLGSYPRELR